VSTVNIAINKGLKTQVRTLLSGICEAITADTALSNQQMGLLQATRIPLYKIFNVQAAYQQDSSILDIESYADVIALDLLFAYLQDSLKTVAAASKTLPYPDALMAEFNHGIESAMTSLRAEQTHLQHKITTAAQLIEQSQVLEQGLSGALSTELGNQLE
jgi:conjugative transfer pilus assembly protein TraH